MKNYGCKINKTELSSAFVKFIIHREKNRQNEEMIILLSFYSVTHLVAGEMS